ncbi:MFS transporter [Leifsonia sp. H3M29-4]|uniref:MFS transporter n=1 Tax=Salinibacterium metalliresistens TaxID=3031321 RepID=UPI0023DB3162|nr:MFS transporter [Salinibacterium metalliresistens]MDF1479633.1 MFS transporter [Salinibacterium metalliresistens]
MSTAEPPFSWRAIALPALLPTLLFSIGEGAIIPIIPLVASNLGASLAIAGLVAALLLIGELIGNIPSGWLVARIGERPAMIGAAALSVVGLVICLIAPHPVALAFGVLLVGLSAAVFALARHAFLTSFVPLAYRARALSTLGGVFRLGFFVGPFITAAVIQLTGVVAFAFWIHVIACLATALVLVTLPDPTTTFGSVRTVRLAGRELREGEALVEQESSGLFRTLVARRDVLARLGLGAALVGALRASRQVILPLWAVSIGVGDADAALVIGIAGGVDFALFYLSGSIMDRFGRLWTAVPSMVGLGIGHLALALTHDLSTNVQWFIAAAMILALANGLGSGILMTLGADLADPANPAPFLGAWRFTGGLGGAAAPLLLSAITAAASLAVGAGVLGVLGFVGAGVLARYVPRYLPRQR